MLDYFAKYLQAAAHSSAIKISSTNSVRPPTSKNVKIEDDAFRVRNLADRSLAHDKASSGATDKKPTSKSRQDSQLSGICANSSEARILPGRVVAQRAIDFEDDIDSDSSYTYFSDIASRSDTIMTNHKQSPRSSKQYPPAMASPKITVTEVDRSKVDLVSHLSSRLGNPVQKLSLQTANTYLASTICHIRAIIFTASGDYEDHFTLQISCPASSDDIRHQLRLDTGEFLLSIKLRDGSSLSEVENLTSFDDVRYFLLERVVDVAESPVRKLLAGESSNLGGAIANPSKSKSHGQQKSIIAAGISSNTLTMPSDDEPLTKFSHRRPSHKSRTGPHTPAWVRRSEKLSPNAQGNSRHSHRLHHCKDCSSGSDTSRIDDDSIKNHRPSAQEAATHFLSFVAGAPAFRRSERKGWVVLVK